MLSLFLRFKSIRIWEMSLFGKKPSNFSKKRIAAFFRQLLPCYLSVDFLVSSITRLNFTSPKQSFRHMSRHTLSTVSTPLGWVSLPCTFNIYLQCISISLFIQWLNLSCFKLKNRKLILDSKNNALSFNTISCFPKSYRIG